MCISCKERVRPRQEGLQCDGCLPWQHRTCHTGVSQADYRNAVKTGASINWRCLTCDFPQAESTALSENLSEISASANPDADFDSEETTDRGNFRQLLSNFFNLIVNVNDLMEGASERGKRKLIDSNGFSYNVKRQRLEATDWQCTVRPTVIFFFFCHHLQLFEGARSRYLYV